QGGSIGVTTEFAGNGGEVRISGGNVTMDQVNAIPSAIVALTFADGLGGNITLNLAGTLQLHNSSFISADTFGVNEGGSINIHAQPLSLDPAASIRCSSPNPFGLKKPGRAGAISIAVDKSVLMNSQAVISTSAPNSNGGDITLNAGYQVQLTKSQ